MGKVWASGPYGLNFKLGGYRLLRVSEFRILGFGILKGFRVWV